MTTSRAERIRKLEQENLELREANAILKDVSVFFAEGGTRPPWALIVTFTNVQRARGGAVEPICAVLRERGVQIAAQTYRNMRRCDASVRDCIDAVVIDALLATAGTPEGMCTRRKIATWAARAYRRRPVRSIA